MIVPDGTRTRTPGQRDTFEAPIISPARHLRDALDICFRNNSGDITVKNENNISNATLQRRTNDNRRFRSSDFNHKFGADSGGTDGGIKIWRTRSKNADYVIPEIL